MKTCHTHTKNELNWKKCNRQVRTFCFHKKIHLLSLNCSNVWFSLAHKKLPNKFKMGNLFFFLLFGSLKNIHNTHKCCINFLNKNISGFALIRFFQISEILKGEKNYEWTFWINVSVRICCGCSFMYFCIWRNRMTLI